MKVKRLSIAVILGGMFLTGPVWAQEDGNVTPATAALQDVLSNLKQSVEKLSLDNDQLQARDSSIKQQILQFQMQLRQLETQADLLNKEVGKLSDKNPRRAGQISRLEAKDAEYQQGPAVVSPESPAADHSQKEKLKLMKMIYDSQQRQELLHEAIAEFQKNTPLPPAAGILEHQQPDVPYQQDDAQLHQLELELQALEQNYLQLKDLMGQMSQKAAVRMTVSQHIEMEKLQSSIDDLNRQGTKLKADLDDLRSQMVDLDKRKSSLEIMIRQMP